MSNFTPQDTTGNFRFTDPTYLGPKGKKRSLILWELPHLGGPNRYIEMYINPQAITANNKKIISRKRTKGGFMIQYWGEELEALSINGVTGDGGIEALNALNDAYRSEQLALVAITQARSADSDVFKRRQPLAALATSVIMWYQGQGKRGFFEGFSYTESVQNQGSFEYRFDFIVTEIIGIRANYMAWHRKPWSTTDTPNIGVGGSIVTGGYAGDTKTRLGPLNSVSGTLAPVDSQDPDGAVTTTDQFIENDLFDPKYDPDTFSAPQFAASQFGFAGNGPNQPASNNPAAISTTPVNPTSTTDTAVTDSNVTIPDHTVVTNATPQ